MVEVTQEKVEHLLRAVDVRKASGPDDVSPQVLRHCSNFGGPRSVLCDNAKEFTGHEMRTWADQHGVELLFSTPYHPQANGMIERMHRTLKTVLAQLCEGYPQRWPNLLAECQKVMNAAVHSSTRVTPYVAFFGRHPPRNITAPLPTITSDHNDAGRLKRLIQEASTVSLRRYRAFANRHRKNEKVELGSLVWVKQETIIPGTCAKLNQKWKGPYKVAEIIRDGLIYILEDPFTGKNIQRAAEKIKPYVSHSDIIVQLGELIENNEPDDDDEDIVLPPRHRRPPRRFLEEM
ncbi:hypothetical protein Pmani_005095 [Petrolisthes manimaculis]|uniref:Integrase catalytic domain-containing protein n=1 Tax=Petrolisthes manimaculis TaxID=1843537 RepID=A0AAE1QCE4_9EUCA|nr:hypothetical protein Pmani_005095 [Petrolisthes manimaculis]